MFFSLLNFQAKIGKDFSMEKALKINLTRSKNNLFIFVRVN